MSLINIIGNVIGALKSIIQLPSCVDSIATVWVKNLNSYDENNIVLDSVGYETRDIYYGQYLSSGTINLYRTEGTYDYIDPSDGSSVTGNTIPIDGLITIPANGICEITTSDGSWYPICERAGTVLHDVNGTSIHISIDTPIWDETLYGSDYLNQYGYVNKSDFNDKGYTWETIVDGSAITLNDNCIVPLAQWELELLYDSEGVQLFDSEGEPLYVKN